MIRGSTSEVPKTGEFYLLCLCTVQKLMDLFSGAFIVDKKCSGLPIDS